MTRIIAALAATLIFSSSAFAEVNFLSPSNQRFYPVKDFLTSFSQRDILDELERALASVKDEKPYSGIVFRECGVANSYFERASRRISICYEMVEKIARTARVSPPTTVEGVTMMAVIYLVLHEFGHALIQSSSVPIMGREEDAADQIAAVIAKRIKPAPIINSLAATVFRDTSAFGIYTRKSAADEHSFDLQRLSNFVCWSIGNDQYQLSRAVQARMISTERARRCGDESEMAERAYQVMIR